MKKKIIKIICYPCYSFRIYQIPLILKKNLCKTNFVLFLTYHRVLPHDLIDKSLSQRSMIVSLETFREQLKFLQKHYIVISLDEYFYFKESGRYNKKKPYAIISFDDGWGDNYLFAFEELRRAALPAIIYLTSGYIGTDKIFWPEEITEILLNITPKDLHQSVRMEIKQLLTENIYQIILKIINESDFYKKKEYVNILILHLKVFPKEKIYNLKRLLNLKKKTERLFYDRLLTWNEVYELKKNNISVGAHTHSHTILTNVSLETANEEINKSKKIIEQKVGHRIADFSYPNGAFNSTIINLLHKAEFRSAVTGINKLSTFRTSPFEIHRKGINELRFIKNNGEFDIIATTLEWTNFIGFFRGVRKNKYH